MIDEYQSVPLDRTSLLGRKTQSLLSRVTSNRRALYIGGIVFSLLVIFIIIGLAVGLSKNEHEKSIVVNFEALFTQTISGDQIRDYVEEYSSVSHIAGSEADHQQAVSTKSKFESWGFESRIHEVPALLTYPMSRLVEITYPEDKKFVCSLKEPAIPQDKTSGKPAADTFNGYSAGGDVTAELVYANYGTEQDFETLDAMNISVSGKIVIVRYGLIFRGNKVQSAENRGAVGVLIYFEPDAPSPQTIYPKGPWRTNETVQRGSVNMGDGDPETPGWPSTWGGPRLSVSQAKNLSYVDDPLPNIPVQPLSFGDAAPLLAALGGANIPSADWQGNLNFTYHIGPGPVQVHIKLDVNYTVTPIWNVLGMIKGAEEPDRYIILGCHRDAWTFGAADPISGHSIFLEIARAFGVLKSQGWAPRRTIIFASWDAEEYALIGSVEFVETYLNTIQDRTVAYLNLDTAVTGGDVLELSASWSFKNILDEITKIVPIGNKKMNDIWSGAINIPGGGSDFTAFIQHVGVSVLYPQMRAADRQYDAVYHSNYDSFYWMDHFADPEWKFHPALAKVVGLITKRLSDDIAIPLDINSYAASILNSVNVLKEKAAPFPLTRLVQSATNLVAVTQNFVNELSKINKTTASFATLRSYNDKIMLFERTFLTDDPTLTGALSWYKHVVYASSGEDWYAGVAFSALGQAIADKNGELIEFLEGRLALMLDGTAATLTEKPFGF